MQDPGDIFNQREYSQLKRYFKLSERQFQITKGILKGLSDNEISNQLGIGVSTVRTHISRLFKKVDVDDRMELILKFLSEFRKTCQRLDCPRKKVSE